MKRTYSKEEIDQMASEAFEEDEIEKNFDLGFNPNAVIAGDEGAVAEFKQLRARAKKAQDE